MTVIKLRRGTAVEWATANPVLNTGEQGFEIDTGKFKIGDGVSNWFELQYFTPGAGTGGDGGVALAAHIVSVTPHTVYDDGPSLDLLYQNAKV